MEKVIKIAFMGNCTTDYAARALKLECDRRGIPADIYNCPFNQYNQEALNRDSNFYRFAPELLFFLLEGEVLLSDWHKPDLLTRDSGIKAGFVQAAFNSVTQLIEHIHSNISAKVIFNNFKIPYHSPLGILDGKYYPGLKDMYALLNLKLNEWAGVRDYVYIFDYNGLAAKFGGREAEDPKLYYSAKIAMSFPFTNALAAEYMRYVLPFRYMNKKCLVLDLDNTLWGGVVGEDGISGIKLDIAGAGRSFYDFQREILNLHARGIILAINSKNNMEDAVAAIEKHPHMLLRKEHFSCLKINWQDKVQNLGEIAAELNIGLDSMAFFDDNPVEREFVRAMLPMVKVVDVPTDTSKYANTLKDLVDFELLALTGEDIKRNAMYAENLKRLEFMQKFKDKEDYLSSLKTKVSLQHAGEFSIPRIAQLTQKTNQFNMTTKRYSQADVENMLKSGKYLVLSCEVSDKFGDNGIAGVCIAKVEDSRAEIDTFLLSCRVMGRNVEFAFIDRVVSLLRERGVEKIGASFIKTDKNKANENFYADAGFMKSGEYGKETLYSLDGNGETKKISYIEVVMGRGK